MGKVQRYSEQQIGVIQTRAVTALNGIMR